MVGTVLPAPPAYTLELNARPWGPYKSRDFLTAEAADLVASLSGKRGDSTIDDLCLNGIPQGKFWQILAAMNGYNKRDLKPRRQSPEEVDAYNTQIVEHARSILTREEQQRLLDFAANSVMNPDLKQVPWALMLGNSSLYDNFCERPEAPFYGIAEQELFVRIANGQFWEHLGNNRRNGHAIAVLRNRRDVLDPARAVHDFERINKADFRFLPANWGRADRRLVYDYLVEVEATGTLSSAQKDFLFRPFIELKGKF